MEAMSRGPRLGSMVSVLHCRKCKCVYVQNGKQDRVGLGGMGGGGQ